ncbi:MAG: terpene cyclase/mutase family protein [Candidatus Taylorbacteria bacterium]|nr:terpene cyclase/mutase family protein [Candidatus Taylorbacteria bacterium]
MKASRGVETAAVAFFAVASSFFVGTPFAEAQSTSTPSATIRLSIETATTTLFDAEIEVLACPESASSTPFLTGYCAVESSGLDTTWSPWGDMLFLDGIAGSNNDFSAGLSWNWFSDLEYGQTSLDEHILVEGESLLVAIGRMPLKMSFATTTPEVGATTTVSVFEFGFDAGWNPAWLPSSTTTVLFAGTPLITDANGHADIVATSTDSIAVIAEKGGFISARASLAPRAAAVPAQESEPQEPQSNSQNQESSVVVSFHRAIDAAKAISFLAANQREDGSFGSDLYTDWAAIALATAPYSEARDKASRYLSSSALASGSATDYERRAMALMALNIDPRTGTSVDHIAKIVGFFDGEQIGDKSLVNDDIFAIFPLAKAGFLASDEILKKTVSFILSKQREGGSWEGSADLTAAAIQALSLTPSLEGVGGALSSARGYLMSLPRSEGGFGNSYTTSWALQAIAALGESPSAWMHESLDPNDYLYGLQKGDGGIGDVSLGQSSRVWATSYAVPASLGRTWGSILSSYSKPPGEEARAPQALVAAREPEESSSAATTTLPVISPVPVPLPEPLALIDEPAAYSETQEDLSGPTPTVEPDISSREPAKEGESLAAAFAAGGKEEAKTRELVFMLALFPVGGFAALWIIKSL